MTRRRSGQAQRGPRSRQAIDWFVEREGNPERDRASRLQWDAWSATPENRADYAVVVRVHQNVRTLLPPAQPSREELLSDLRDDPDVIVVRPEPTEAATRLLEYCGVLARLRPALIPTTWTHLLAAAALVLAVGYAVWISLFTTVRDRYEGTPAERSYASAPGEQRTFVLSDGSSITLGGDTALVVRFTPAVRSIELTHGDALFQVAHDRQRPFVVHAAGGTTTALGTAFEIRLYAHHAQVWVREGTVEVAPLKEVAFDNTALPEVARWIPVRLAPGEEMSYNAHGEASAPKTADPHVAEAWTQGSLLPLIYHGRPLPEVIEDVQRYSRRRILLDPDLADLRFSGIVLRVDGWLRDLPEIYPVEVIDCHTSRHSVPECSDPERVFIRSRWRPREDGPESVRR